MTDIQWYPGHIAKLARMLPDLLKQVDVLIEVLDARLPYSTEYRELSQSLLQKKPVLLLLNKADLADPQWTALWAMQFKQRFPVVMAFN
jgi:ribosome biogenesis GTPase A